MVYFTLAAVYMLRQLLMTFPGQEREPLRDPTQPLKGCHGQKTTNMPK